MFSLPSAWTYKAGLPSEVRIPRFWDDTVPVIGGRCTDTVFLLTPVRAKRTNISPRVLHKRLQLHSKAREAKVWVEVEDRAHMLGLQRSKGVSTQLYHLLSQRISQLYRVCFCYHAYGQGYYLILVHHIHSSLHHV